MKKILVYDKSTGHSMLGLDFIIVTPFSRQLSHLRYYLEDMVKQFICLLNDMEII